MPTKTAPVDPRDLLLQAAEAIEQGSDCLGDDSPHLGLVYAVEREWDATDRRFAAARALIDHDRLAASAAYSLLTETMGLLVQITDQTEDMIALQAENVGREDVRQTASELRDAIDRLHRIIDAVTAVHSL